MVFGLHEEPSAQVSLGLLYHSRFGVQPTYGAREYQSFTETALSGYHLGGMEPWRFISCALRNSCLTSVGFEPRTFQSAVKRATTGPMHPVWNNTMYVTVIVNVS